MSPAAVTCCPIAIAPVLIFHALMRRVSSGPVSLLLPVLPTACSQSPGSRQRGHRAQSTFREVPEAMSLTGPHTIRRAISSPKLLPPVTRLRGASSRTKGSSERSWSDSGIPERSLSMTTRNSASFRSIRTVARPPQVAISSSFPASRSRHARAGPAPWPGQPRPRHRGRVGGPRR